MKPDEVAALPCGLYRVFWHGQHDGGSAVCTVGTDAADRHWWVALGMPSDGPCYNWANVLRCEPVSLDPAPLPTLPQSRDGTLGTAEHMAIAVLRGEADTARMLADLLLEGTPSGAVRLPPVRKVTVDRGRLRALVYVKDDAELTEAAANDLYRGVERWLDGETTIAVTGIDRVELYELPATFGTVE